MNFEMIGNIAEILGYVCAIATIVAAMTPSQKDDSTVGKVVGYVNKVLALFPTLGKNPRTRELESKLESKKL